MQNSGKISVTLPTEMLRQLREAVAAGDYASTSEALRDAVRAWHRQRREDAERLTALRARVQQSLADPRPSFTEEEVEARLDVLFCRDPRRPHPPVKRGGKRPAIRWP